MLQIFRYYTVHAQGAEMTQTRVLWINQIWRQQLQTAPPEHTPMKQLTVTSLPVIHLFNLIYCYQIPTTNNSCRKRNADIMTHRHSTQPWDTNSLQPPTIQANNINTSEYLMTYAGSASCKQWETRRKRIVTTLNKQTQEQVKRNTRKCVSTSNIIQDGISRDKSSSTYNKQAHVES